MKEQSSILPLTSQKLAKDEDLNKICRVQAPSATHQAARSLGLHLLYGPHRQKPGPEVIKHFSFSTQLSTKFILLINVKMLTIVGILTPISRINTPNKSLTAKKFIIFHYFSFN